jgi:hypothetical protein
MPKEASMYRKGDRCRILKEGHQVEHYDCHTYADGVITDARTGKVLNR